MELEVRFTPADKNDEIPFTIVEDKDEGIFLYSKSSGQEYKIKLVNNGGTLSIEKESHPF